MCTIFFFQAEAGIRVLTVTGVQTCALPICPAAHGIAATEMVPADGPRASLRTYLEACIESRERRRQLCGGVRMRHRERKSVGLGKRVEFGGRRIINKKKRLLVVVCVSRYN